MMGERQLLAGKPKNKRSQMCFVPAPLSAARWGLRLWFPGKNQKVKKSKSKL